MTVKFDISLPDNLAPVYDHDGRPLTVAPYQVLAHSNYLRGVDLGLWPAQADFSKAGVSAMQAHIQSRPLGRMLACLAASTPSDRKALMRRSADELHKATGLAIEFDQSKPSNPLYFWHTDRLYAITGDGRMLFGMRGNQTTMGPGCLQATGNGYASIGPDGLPLSSEQNALKEMREEFGLSATTARVYGHDRHMTTMQYYNLPAEGGTVHVPGIVPCHAATSVHQFRETLGELLPRIRLNWENLGVFPLRLRDLEFLAAGKPAVAECYWSSAREVRVLFGQAKSGRSADHTFAQTMGKIASKPNAPRVPRDWSYALNVAHPHRVVLKARDLQILDANYLENGLLAFQAAGCPLSDASLEYIHNHGHVQLSNAEQSQGLRQYANLRARTAAPV